jgi:hypothetical protein
MSLIPEFYGYGQQCMPDPQDDGDHPQPRDWDEDEYEEDKENAVILDDAQKELNSFFKKLSDSQEKLPAEFAKILYANLDNLYLTDEKE